MSKRVQSFMRAGGMGVVLVATLLCLSTPAAAQPTLPNTPCDAVLANDELHPVSAMILEDGTHAFSYSRDGSFVTGAGGSVVLTVALTFDPGPEATIRLSALDEQCGGANGARTSFAYTFSNLAARNTISFDARSGDIVFNGTTEHTGAATMLRYFFVDVWDGELPSTHASYSYLVDLQNPANPR